MPFSAGFKHCLGYKSVDTTNAVMVADVWSKYYKEHRTSQLLRGFLQPKGTVAANANAACFELILTQRVINNNLLYYIRFLKINADDGSILL